MREKIVKNKNPLEELFVYDLSLPKQIKKSNKTPLWKLVLYYIASKVNWESKDPFEFLKIIDFVIKDIEEIKETSNVR
jgi:hypothetical protein